MPPPSHIPVLLRETLAALAPGAGETYADCTAGLGGHAAAVAAHMADRKEGQGTIILNDADASNLARAVANVQAAAGSHIRAKPSKQDAWVDEGVEEVEAGGTPAPRDSRDSTAVGIISFHGNFADLPRKMQDGGLAADMLLADLGFASNQVDDAARGFSFMREGPLDMRLDPTRALSAADLVNKGSEGELTSILRDYGEEPSARRIAAAIVRARKAAPLLTTTALADLVKSTIGHRPGANHPATKTFQGLRIAVNDELGSLEALLAAIRQAAVVLQQAIEETRQGLPGHPEQSWLRPGARIAMITFHSLEDRPVKRVFTELVKEGLAEEIGRGKCAASDEEIAGNPRARSAKLRAIRLLPPTMPK